MSCLFCRRLNVDGRLSSLIGLGLSMSVRPVSSSSSSSSSCFRVVTATMRLPCPNFSGHSTVLLSFISVILLSYDSRPTLIRLKRIKKIGRELPSRMSYLDSLMHSSCEPDQRYGLSILKSLDLSIFFVRRPY